ncbi:MAG: hypothetical protein ACSLFO_10780 [Acidimicrobiales bacterium]
MASEGGLPPVEVIEEPSGSWSESAVTSGRVTWRSVVVAAAVVAFAGLAVASQFTGDGPTDDEGASATSQASSGSYITGSPQPVFGAPVEASLLLGSLTGGWRVLELSTGRMEEAPALDGVDPAGMVAVRGGVVVLDDTSMQLSMLTLPVDDPGGQTDLVDFPPGRPASAADVVGVVAAGGDEHLWVLTEARRPAAVAEAVLVGLDGRAVIGPIDVPAWPIAGTSVGLVYDAGGRTYSVGPHGIEDLGAGTAYAASASVVGRVACDPVGRCRQEITEIGSGSVTRSAGVAAAAAGASRGSIRMAISDTGVLATLAAFLPESAQGADAATTLFVTGSIGPSRGIVVDEPRSGPAWLPGGDGVLVLTGRGLVRYVVIAGRLVGEPAAAVEPHGADTVLVIAE